MATPTVNPAADNVLDVYLPLVGMGVGEAQQELVDRLKANLPGVITEYNTRNGLTGNRAIQPIEAGFHVAPAVLTEKYINSLLVGVAVETTPQGIGGAYKNEVEVVVYVIDRRVVIGEQVIQHWKRAELARACLHAFLHGCVNQDGRVCWRSLVPSGYSMLSSDWSQEYSGVAANFRMVIPPSTG